MSYHLYHTDAFVIGGTPSGEGSRILALFTRELGMISASARSVREERSKLRYGLQDFSFSEVTLVRGRDSWRITNASIIESVSRSFQESSQTLALFTRVFRLLRRLLQGEGKNEPLFATIVSAYSFLKNKNSISLEQANIEIVLVLRILFLLGYLSPRSEFLPFISDVLLWDDNLVEIAGMFRSLAIADINHSLTESQL